MREVHYLCFERHALSALLARRAQQPKAFPGSGICRAISIQPILARRRPVILMPSAKACGS